MNLLQILAQLPDFRAARGRRYPLWLVLLLVIMGTMSGCFSYCALEDFARRHHLALQQQLELSPLSFPSDSTFRRIMTRINFAQLAQVFNQWAKQQITIQETEWLAVDGKSIRSTVIDCYGSYQDFVNVVSVFSNCQGVPIAIEQFRNKESSEIAVVQTILASLNLKGVVFSCDALHCQKKQSS